MNLIPGDKMKLILSLALLMSLFSCATSTRFKVPEGTDLYVYNQKVNPSQYQRYEHRPYSWGTAGGVKYRLEKEGKVIEKGTLKTKFRVVSIFWPPAAIAYWPMGFESREYDFNEKSRMIRPDITDKK
jgi:hypothetical protein